MDPEGWGRRDVLARGTLGASLTLSGCLRATWIGDDSDESPTGSPDETGDPSRSASGTDADRSPQLEFETAYHETTGQVLDGGIGGESRKEHYATVLTTDAESDRFEMPALDEGTAAFVEETSFPGEILLVVQRHLHSISHELDLTWVRIEEGSLSARVEVLHDDVLDAATNATLVGRVDLGGHPTPEGGTVAVVDEDSLATTVEIDYTENS